MQFAKHLSTLVVNTTPRRDDDFGDRLNYRYTTFTLVVFGVILLLRSFVGDTIACLPPGQFTAEYYDYATTVCSINASYFKWLPGEGAFEEDDKLGYYQESQFVLLLMAFLFYVPTFLWRGYVANSGLNLKKIIASCIESRNSERISDKLEAATSIAAEIEEYLLQRDGGGDRLTALLDALKNITFTGHRGDYLASTYIAVKLLFLANVASQFFILSSFLGFDFSSFGYKILREYGRSANETVYFPRLIYCQFSIYQFGRDNTYTLQCVLPVNFFLEKMFMIIWYLYIAVAVISGYCLLWWLHYFLLPSARTNYISKYIDHGIGQKKDLIRFVRGFLRNDGFFIIRLISLNVDDLTMDDVLNICWNNWRSELI